MLRASVVACSKSFSAPVLTSLKTSSSEARPPSSPFMRSQSSAAREQELVVRRQLQRVAQGGAAAGNDADLVHRVGMFAVGGDQGMAHFVIGHAAFAFLVQAAALALRAGHHLFDGLFQILLGNLPRPAPRGQQGGLVDGVGQVGSGKAGRPLGDLSQVDAIGQRFAVAMDFQDRLPPIHVRRVDHHLAVEAAGPQQGLIQDLGAVGGRQENDADVGLEAVHLDQELVEGLFALVVDRSEMHAPLAPDGVQFVDEDDAGGLLLGLLEQVADPRRPHAHEHFHKVAAAQREERDFGLAGDRTGEQRFPGAGQSHQQHALGNPGAQARCSGPGFFRKSTTS